MTTNNSTARHPKSETLDLIAEYVKDGTEWSLSQVADSIQEHTLSRWQMELKPGNVVVRLHFEPGDDPDVSYARIIEVDEETIQEALEKEAERGTFRELIATVIALGTPPPDTTFEPFTMPVWDAQYKLTESQARAAEEAGYPSRFEEFIGVLLKHDVESPTTDKIPERFRKALAERGSVAAREAEHEDAKKRIEYLDEMEVYPTREEIEAKFARK